MSSDGRDAATTGSALAEQLKGHLKSSERSTCSRLSRIGRSVSNELSLLVSLEITHGNHRHLVIKKVTGSEPWKIQGDIQSLSTFLTDNSCIKFI